MFEFGVLSAVQLLLMLLIAIGLIDLVYVLIRSRLELTNIDSIDGLQGAMQRGFSGILLVLIGLELLETVRAYLKDHHVRLRIVLIVAVIALGRHILEIELENQSGMQLIGVAALVLALTVGYYLIRNHRPGTKISDKSKDATLGET